MHLSSILESRTLHWPDEAACAASADALARHGALRNAFIELHGPLGAGKTTFVRHLLHALGVPGRIKSPTYTVMEPYETVAAAGAPLAIYHFDFYRFDDPQEWEDAGFRDVFASPGLKLAEWPQKAEDLLPEADLRVTIEPVDLGADGGRDDARHVTFDAHTARGLDLLPR
ncbi:MAG TPA: tRNA (adenosine(37)-N6)-threonylcarbamoyltransferase complex ATPase subunit type 1 TsaE [Burkholderiaceae bacterium]|nr:tRNA (adenosine(37)-N6)-threonylcarbamoyltransferase complex ATPase subunit type 1 TsaE [Burkholderiaceae bacterium]